MSTFLKFGLKGVAYTAFFLAALVFFVYLTLPLEQIETWLVRKAADEHNLDLEISSLRTKGVFGIEMAGVMLRPRPTLEQMEALSRARERRRQWELAQAEKKAQAQSSEGQAAEKPAKTVRSAAASAPGSVAASAAAEAAAQPEAQEQPPPLPVGPQPLLLDDVRVSLSAWDLLKGRVQGTLSVEALGGTLQAKLEQGEESAQFTAKWEQLMLEQLPVLRAKVGMPFAGQMIGEADLQIPLSQSKRPDLAQITGQLQFLMLDGQLGPAPTVPAGSSLHEALVTVMFKGVPSDQIPAEIVSDLPALRFTRMGGDLIFDGGRATLKDFRIEGPDMVGDIVGRLEMASQFSKWVVRLHQRFKFTEEFLAVKENQTLQTLMQGNSRVRQSIDGEGYMGLQYSGFLSALKPLFVAYNSVRPRPRGAGAAPKAPAAGGAAAAARRAGAGGVGARAGRAGVQAGRARPRVGSKASNIKPRAPIAVEPKVAEPLPAVVEEPVEELPIEDPVVEEGLIEPDIEVEDPNLAAPEELGDEPEIIDEMPEDLVE